MGISIQVLGKFLFVLVSSSVLASALPPGNVSVQAHGNKPGDAGDSFPDGSRPKPQLHTHFRLHHYGGTHPSPTRANIRPPVTAGTVCKDTTTVEMTRVLTSEGPLLPPRSYGPSACVQLFKRAPRPTPQMIRTPLNRNNHRDKITLAHQNHHQNHHPHPIAATRYPPFSFLPSLCHRTDAVSRTAQK